MGGLYKVDEMPTEGQFIGVVMSDGLPWARVFRWVGDALHVRNDTTFSSINPDRVVETGYTFYVADRRRGDRRKA